MGLDATYNSSSSYCSFCGALLVGGNSKHCLDCGASFCNKCALELHVNGNTLQCPCGSTNIEDTSLNTNITTQAIQEIFELKKQLKQVAYRPVIALKRTGHSEQRFRSLRKQFLIPRHDIDKIFLETKKIEHFILEELPIYSDKLRRLYHIVMNLDKNVVDDRNLSMQFNLFSKQIISFDQTIQTKLEPIFSLIESLEKQCVSFENMSKQLNKYFDIFVLTPGELGIGFFSHIDLHRNKNRKKTIDLAVTTDRIVMLVNIRHKVISNKTHILDEFPPEDLIDVKKSSSGFLKKNKLSIQTINQDYELQADSQTLLRIYDALQKSYYGRPSDLYIFEPFRDWSSENYQEKILKALNLQDKKVEKNKPETNTIPKQEKDPEFVLGVLEDRLRDLRIRKLANEKALQELREVRRKVPDRDYFDLIRQFELEVARINEEIAELLRRTGKTNLFD
ncbi:MAG: hypothetical protein ACTSW1_08145 [Candidatus Hodarchaeales archaeon]